MKIKNQTAMAFGACASMGLGVLVITFIKTPNSTEFWALFLEQGQLTNMMRIALGSGISVAVSTLIIVSNISFLPAVVFALGIVVTLIPFGLITMPFSLWALGASAYWIYRRNTQPIT